MIKKLLCVSYFVVFVMAQSCSQEFQVIFDEESLPVRPETAEANMTTISDRDTIRNLIIEKAREYLGVGYRYGQSGEDGFDCSGFVRLIYGHFNYSLPHSSYEQYKRCTHLKERKARPGDLVFFVTRGNQISHVGIYLGDNSFIHSPSSGKKVCIDSLNADYYKKRLAGFGKVLR
jgi:cell wall-associated NlpC family hydrolase